MSTERPLLSRPIVVTSSNDSFTFTYNSVAHSLTLTNGVYPCVRRLVYEFCTQINGTGHTTISGAFNASTYVLTLTHNGGLTWNSITWTDTDLRDLLGFTGSESVAANVLTATHRPSTTWFPTFQPADQGAWALRQEEMFSGVTARNGRNVGLQTGPARWQRSYDFVHEPAARVLCEFATSAYDYDRTLEQFVMLSRTATNNDGAVSAKGFYVYHDMADALTTAAATLDDGGVTWQYTSSPETYVYCHPSVEGTEIGAASMPVARQRYNVPGFAVHTATAPTWTAP